MKKTILCVMGVLIVFIGIWIVGIGFRKENAVFVDDYSLNDDNSVMTIHVGVSSSIGYIRKAVISQNEDGNIQIYFISAFGGLNGSISAKSTYDIPISESSTSISVYQGDHYRLILTKDLDSGEWSPVDWIPRSLQ